MTGRHVTTRCVLQSQCYVPILGQQPSKEVPVFGHVNRWAAPVCAFSLTVLTVAGVGLGSSGPAASASSEPWTACTSGLNISSSPRQPGTESAILRAVSAPSAADAWAVGELDVQQQPSLPYIQHWNGAAWSTASIDLPLIEGTALNMSSLTAVIAFSPTDVWAGGTQQAKSGLYSPVLLHWDGTAWTLRSLPLPAGSSRIVAFAGTGGSDLWVGEGTGNQVSYLDHYDGSNWTSQSSPVTIQTLTSFSPDQVEIGGETEGDDATIADYQGGNWSLTGDPGSSEVADLSGPGPDDLWAVGTPGRLSDLWELQHYNGTDWTNVASAASGIVVASNGTDTAEAILDTSESLTGGPIAVRASDPPSPSLSSLSTTQLAWDPSWGSNVVIRSIAASPRGALFAVGSILEAGHTFVQEGIVFRDCPG
jgi:hypothetical protein